jgi:hypothetical protein
MLDLCGARHSILWAAHSIPPPLYRKFVNVRWIARIWTPTAVYAVDINPLRYVPIFSVNVVMDLWCCVIVGLFSIPITRHQINACIWLMLVRPCMSLMTLPWHRFPKEIP